MNIGYLGPQNSFTYNVAKGLFPKQDLIAYPSIFHVVKKVEEGIVHKGVVPLENYRNSIVTQTFDALINSKSKISQEHYIPIVHCAGALKNHVQIRKIFSHQQAIEQCIEYIYRHFPEASLISTGSTSEAAEIVSKAKKYDAIAIASKEALNKNRLEIIAEDIIPKNATRFAVISNEVPYITGKDKTMLAIDFDEDKPGLLAEALIDLKAFNLRHLNSRSDKGNGYTFVLEIDTHLDRQSLHESLAKIRGLKADIKVLGTYPDTGWKK